MKSKEYSYIKLYHLVKYIFIAIFMGRELFLNTFLGKDINIMAMLIFYSAVIFWIFKGFGLENTMIMRELKRRTDNLPVAKENIFSWNNKGEVGVFFTDPEKGTLWFCSNQTNYDLYIYSMMEFNIYESNTTIFFEKIAGDCDLQKFKVFKSTNEY
ncbi:hypothetical protein [Leptotrichia wadei]|uniref:hypothetical protein n=1 Tax=Leptotrichia wadei TaxID=157687 RepID=UPI0028D1C398|nr:hypothetical protein [Leptotrichia wadei]